MSNPPTLLKYFFIIFFEEEWKLGVKRFRKPVELKPSDFRMLFRNSIFYLFSVDQNFIIQGDPMCFIPLLINPVHIPKSQKFRINYICTIFFFYFPLKGAHYFFSNFNTPSARIPSIVFISRFS